MEIKTGEEIYGEGLDKIWYNKKSKYDDATTKDRKMFGLKKWVAVDDLLKWLKDYECPHGEGSICNCCDGITEMKNKLRGKTK